MKSEIFEYWLGKEVIQFVVVREWNVSVVWFWLRTGRALLLSQGLTLEVRIVKSHGFSSRVV